jgi:hypothetical protein
VFQDLLVDTASLRLDMIQALVMREKALHYDSGKPIRCNLPVVFSDPDA